MRAKLTAEKNVIGKFEMLLTMPGGKTEWPQEGREYKSEESVYHAIESMYGNQSTWDLQLNDDDNYTITVELPQSYLQKLADQVMDGCPNDEDWGEDDRSPEMDHQNIADAIVAEDDIDDILSMPEMDRWPDTYDFVKNLLSY